MMHGGLSRNELLAEPADAASDKITNLAKFSSKDLKYKDRILTCINDIENCLEGEISPDTVSVHSEVDSWISRCYSTYRGVLHRLSKLYEGILTPACKQAIEAIILPLTVRIIILRKKLDAHKNTLRLSTHSEHLRLSPRDIEWGGIPGCLRDKHITRSRERKSISEAARTSTNSPLMDSIIPKRDPSGEKDQIVGSLDDLNQEDLIRASTVISKFYRMYRTRKWFRLSRQEELEFLDVLGAHPCIVRAIEGESHESESLNSEAEAFFTSETRRATEALRSQQERDIQVAFLDPTRVAIWKYYEINGEFPPTITELLSCIAKGDLRKPSLDPPTDRQASTKSSAQVKKKKVPLVKIVEPERDKTLDELVDAVKRFQFRTGMCDIDEQGIKNQIKARMIRESLEPELADASGIKLSSTHHRPDSGQNPHIVQLVDVTMNLDKVFLQDMFRDHDTFEDSFVSSRQSTRTSIVSKLIEDIVLPLGSQYVYSRCGLPYRRLLLYGPAGCGKMTTVKMIATETGAVVIDFSLLLKLTKDVVASRIEGIKSLANTMTPVIVFVGALENIFPVPSSKLLSKKPSNTSKAPQPREVLNQISEVLKEGKGIIIGTCSDVHCDIPFISSCFDQKYFVPPPNPNERLETIIASFQSNGQCLSGLTAVQKQSIVTVAKYMNRQSICTIIDAASSNSAQTDILRGQNPLNIHQRFLDIDFGDMSKWVGLQ